MQKAQSSWFIDIQSQKEKLLTANDQINWFPEHLKHGRFAKGIESAPDWCISRVLELVSTDANSMFGWFKAGPKLDNVKAKVHILPGELFGQPGMMRMNIAQDPEVIREAVTRLNNNRKG